MRRKLALVGLFTAVLTLVPLGGAAPAFACDEYGQPCEIKTPDAEDVKNWLCRFRPNCTP